MTSQDPKASDRRIRKSFRFAAAVATAASLAVMLAAVPASSVDPLPFPDWPQVLERTADGRAIEDDRRMAVAASLGEDASGDTGADSADAIDGLAHGDPIGSRSSVPAGSASRGLSASAGPETQDTVASHPDGPASAQPDRRPSPKDRAEAVPVHPDPVTESRIRILADSGLLARQSEISESILIMERQIRQAELLNKLMALKGPEAPIEVAPGRFETFAGTPAGRRLAHEIEEGEINARIRMLELRLKEAELKAALAAPGWNARAEPMAPRREAVRDSLAPAPPAYAVLEILGRNGIHSAVVDVGGRGLMVEEGAVLPDGSEVLSVDPDGIVIIRDGEFVELRIGG